MSEDYTITIPDPLPGQHHLTMRVAGEYFDRVRIVEGGEILVGDGTREPTEISVVEFLRRVASDVVAP
jgi:hypothetical protein